MLSVTERSELLNYCICYTLYIQPYTLPFLCWELQKQGSIRIFWYFMLFTGQICLRCVLCAPRCVLKDVVASVLCSTLPIPCRYGGEPRNCNWQTGCSTGIWSPFVAASFPIHACVWRLFTRCQREWHNGLFQCCEKGCGKFCIICFCAPCAYGKVPFIIEQ